MNSKRIDLSAYHPPLSPGVYIFRNGRGRPIYIGKAKSLADRLASYGQKALPAKTMMMLQTAKKLDWIVLNSELEALLTEAAMVRQYQPKYNIQLRDDKRFPMILLTDEPYPKALKVRRSRPGAGRHFGPYRGGTANHLLELISRRFKIRRCNGPLPKRERACIDYDIGRCDAPCVGYLDRESYGRLVEETAAFLGGDTRTIIRELKAEMEIAAGELEFEKAGALCDEVAALEALAEKQVAERPERGDADALAVEQAEDYAVGIVLERRNGVVMECHRFLFDLPIEVDRDEIYRRMVIARYREEVPPLEILLHEDENVVEQLQNIVRTLHSEKRIKVRVPKRGPDFSLAGLAGENARETFRLHSSDRLEKNRNEALAELVELLMLDETPISIEGVDISTMSGKDTVGASVHFRNGLPRKTHYRQYRIRGRQDSDVDAIEEVVRRRARSKEPLPDLLLIDGGMGQLHAAQKALEDEMPKKYPTLISLAKKEELIMTTEGEVIRLARRSPALRLLQHVRDEAHRFGRKYHRQLRGKITQ